MSTCTQIFNSEAGQPWLNTAAGAEPCWYALHTRSQHEKSVSYRLQGQGLDTYLPLVAEVHRWSDRQKIVETPLFACYVFVRMTMLPENWVSVMRVSGILRFVGNRSAAVPIPDSQIESTRTLLASKLPYTIQPFLKIGQRVRVHGGSLDGIEGILTARNGNHTLVISVEPVQRSLAVRIDNYRVEPL